VFSLLRHLTEP